jgi:hypothetical protein
MGDQRRSPPSMVCARRFSSSRVRFRYSGLVWVVSGSGRTMYGCPLALGASRSTSGDICTSASKVPAVSSSRVERMWYALTPSCRSERSRWSRLSLPLKRSYPSCSRSTPVSLVELNDKKKLVLAVFCPSVTVLLTSEPGRKKLLTGSWRGSGNSLSAKATVGAKRSERGTTLPVASTYCPVAGSTL